MTTEKSQKRNRLGHFKREAIINLIILIVPVLLLIAALIGPFLFKLFGK